jgi:hypothetical protein
MSDTDYDQWSTVRPFVNSAAKPSWVPEEDQNRLAAYEKYDQMYWNDPRQYPLRVLDGEVPLYIPNARIIADTTAHYLLKGLEITVGDVSTPEEEDAEPEKLSKADKEKTKLALQAFLKRESFYSRFNEAKLSGVVRGDFAFHLTANPKKAPGKRLSLTAIDPSMVFPIYDDDDPDKLIGYHIAVQYWLPNEPDKTRVRKLTYMIEEAEDGTKRITSEEGIYELEPKWYGTKAKLVKQVLKKSYLDIRITSLPIYWFKNRGYQGEDFGSSELRGLETIAQTISQGDTDVSAALALEGLGVYATDGGRPVNDNGDETDWEVAPGRVMEVPTGSYFRRVEGVGSITPATDQIDYLEGKLNDASGLTDVALGKVDPAVAASGIALSIRFMPTLAKIETRDQAGIDKLTQLFYDWKTWHEVFEKETLNGDIIPVIGDKLPQDRTAKLNELNNMMDRKIITKQYYRDEMEKLGYKFPKDMDRELLKEAQDAATAAREAFLAQKGLTLDDSLGTNDSGTPSSQGDTLPPAGNSSNNRNRPNESAGTEATNQTRDA